MTILTAVACAVKALRDNLKVHTATVYLSDRLTVRATHRLFAGKIPNGRGCRQDINLTIGRPNYKSRKFITFCKKVGEPFPIRKVQITFPPKQRSRRRNGRHK